MNVSVALNGLRYGLMLGLAGVLLAVLGLSPRFSWIPEVPLILTAIAVPLAILVWAGHDVGSHSGSRPQAAAAGVIAGALGGLVAGLAYVLFGKPPLNLPIGAVLGGTVGAVAATAGALLARKRQTPSR